MQLMDRIIRWSITNRLAVVIVAAILVGYGTWTAVKMPVDVFPDLNRPTVAIMTEAPGLAPEEVEVDGPLVVSGRHEDSLVRDQRHGRFSWRASLLPTGRRDRGSLVPR